MVKPQPSKLLSRVRFSLPAFIWAYSSAGLERTPDKREVDGSSPFRPIYGELAQLGEHLLCKQEVIGSIPLFSIANREVSELAL